jgi:hypothetical protein
MRTIAVVLLVLIVAPAVGAKDALAHNHGASISDSAGPRAYSSEAALQETSTSASSGSVPYVIPKWRFAVKTFPYNYSNNPMYGVYRRVGDRTDLGLQIDFGATFSDGESTQESLEGVVERKTDEQDGVRHNVSVYIDFRRWSRVSDRISWYLGARPGSGYSYRESERIDTDTKYVESTEHEFLGLWITAGAEVRLLENVSVSASFQPFGIENEWYEYEMTRDEYDDGQLVGRNRTVKENTDFEIDAHLRPAAYLSIHF